MLYKSVSRQHNPLRGAIVLLQLEEPHIAENALEVKNIVYIRPSESVDTLCVITHSTYPGVSRCQLLYYPLLYRIGVLILVNKYEPEPLRVFSPHLLVCVKQQESIGKQIVKIHSVCVSAPPAIFGIYLIQLGHPHLIIATQHAAVLCVLLRRDYVVLRHAYV